MANDNHNRTESSVTNETNESNDSNDSNLNSKSNNPTDNDQNNGNADSKIPQTRFHYDPSFLLRIPKSDLHIHLDGSIRIPTLIDLAKQQNVSLPSYNAQELQSTVFPPTYSSLGEYLRGFGYITAVLRIPNALERVAYEVAMDAYNVGVRYLELRFAPQLHAIPGTFSIEEVICSVNRGLERAARDADELDVLSGEIDCSTSDIMVDVANGSNNTNEDGEEGVVIMTRMQKLRNLAKRPHPYHPDAPPHHYGIITCAMRFFLPTFGPYYSSFWEVHKGEDPHRVFGLASVALVTAVNNLRRKGRCSGHTCPSDCNKEGGCECSKCGDDNHDSNEHEHDYILPVVAMDIAGAESGYPASDHKEAFNLAHQSFLHKTVHAGEAYGPESIFSAITDLHAERIGHGLHLFRWDVIGEGEGRGGKIKNVKEGEGMSEERKRDYVENLTRYVGAMRICMEVCLTSNLQTMPELKGDIRNHPVRKMIEKGLAVTFCTDNTLVSHTDVVKELTLAVEAFELSPGQLRNIVYNGFKRSFMAKRYREKRDYNRKVISYYKVIEREFGFGDFGSDYGDTTCGHCGREK